MNAKIRAHRILRHLKNYEAAASDSLLSAEVSSLGQIIGVYHNLSGINVFIYVDGISWKNNSLTNQIRYLQIDAIKLPDGLRSKSLNVCLVDGTSYQVPFDGNDGKTFDSLEVLRFLERVRCDIQDFPSVQM